MDVVWYHRFVPATGTPRAMSDETQWDASVVMVGARAAHDAAERRAWPNNPERRRSWEDLWDGQRARILETTRAALDACWSYMEAQVLREVADECHRQRAEGTGADWETLMRLEDAFLNRADKLDGGL
jgi:hypothetical protein